MFELVRLSAFLCLTASLETATRDGRKLHSVSRDDKLSVEKRKYLLEDAIVHRYHDNARDPEGYRTRHDRIDFVHDKDALVGIKLHPEQVIVSRIPAEEDGRERNESRQKPHVGEHHTDGLLCHVERILERSTNCKISEREVGMLIMKSLIC